MNQLDFWLDFFCQEAALSSLELNSVMLFPDNISYTFGS